MRKIFIGLLALLASVYAFLHGTPALGPGLFEVHWGALSQVGWPPDGAQRITWVCGFLVAAGLILLVQGVEELNND